MGKVRQGRGSRELGSRHLESTPKAEARWVLKCLQGGYARALAACVVVMLCCWKRRWQYGHERCVGDIATVLSCVRPATPLRAGFGRSKCGGREELL